MTKDSTGPTLSNYLAVLAVEIAGEVAAFKRSSTAAHVAYLSAGRKLLDARENAPRGQWAPFLAACGGVEPRTARNMMALARAGLTADDVTAAGGVRAALESLRDRPQAETVSGNGTPGEGEKTETVSAPAPAPRTSADRNSAPAGPLTLYQWRRAMSLCTACGGPSPDGAVRCPGCVERVSAQRAKRRVLAAVGGVLAPRIEAAAKAGTGIVLDPAEVAALASPRRRKRKAKP